MVRPYRIGCRPIFVLVLVLPLFIASLAFAEPDRQGQPGTRVSKTFVLQSGPSYLTTQTVPPRPELLAPLTSPPRRMKEISADDRVHAGATVPAKLPLHKGISVKR